MTFLPVTTNAVAMACLKTIIIQIKNVVATFKAFLKNGLLFIPSSGHTGQVTGLNPANTDFNCYNPKGVDI